MYKPNRYRRTSIQTKELDQGIHLERAIERKINNQEPIGSEVATMYPEKKLGVLPSTNIKTDRFEVALDGVDTVQKSYQARSESKPKMEVVKDENKGTSEGNNEVG